MESLLEREINAFLWASLIGVTVFLLSKLTKPFILWAKARPIPGPPSPSFYGHCPLFSRSNLSDLLLLSHKEYGPVIKLWLGPNQLMVSIIDPQLIQEVLLKAADKLPLTGAAFRQAFGRSSFFVSSFGEVEKQRNSLLKALSGKPLEGANLTAKQVLESVIERNQNIVDKLGGLDCETISQQLAFTVQGASLFGDVFLTWSNATIYEELLMKIAKDTSSWTSYSVAPVWKQAFWDYQDTCTKLKSLTQELVQKCRQKYKQDSLTSKNFDTSRASYSSGYLMKSNFLSKECDGFLETDDGPFGNLISIMFHGSLTIAGLISSVLLRLATHPDIQDKIYCEIATARKFCQSRNPLAPDQMPLLLATIYESARLLPAGPLLQRSSLQHDVNLKNGMTIPAGAIVVVPLQLVHTDSVMWGNDAKLFNPYRFLLRPENNSDIHSSSSAEQCKDAGEKSYILEDPNGNAAFLSFGSGSRTCVGRRLAILEISALFAWLLEHYEVRPQMGSECDPKLMLQNSLLKLLPSPKITFIKKSC